ncbi:hypothetical protein C8A05DRAFT_38959 [Staphylotrichum tortipilum]|uniref:Uncharacterized protein n=1 Tax=Staphylotrichum tortipilum TaxID=2831512 RepID=A0AAN6MBN2_9PEZI|nr:hypothetical protein C8A05DRAFT_38959 [Staphylotrichum longicolle]
MSLSKPVRDYLKLTTLTVNAARWDTNQQWRCSLANFVPDDIFDRHYQFLPSEYEFSAFQDWLTSCIGYDPVDHVVVLAQYGVRDDRATVVTDEDMWQDILHGIADGKLHMPLKAELFFAIAPREETPVQFAPVTLNVLGDPSLIALHGVESRGCIHRRILPMFTKEASMPAQEDDDLALRVPEFKHLSPDVPFWDRDKVEAACRRDAHRRAGSAEIEVEEYSGDETTTFEATLAMRMRVGNGEDNWTYESASDDEQSVGTPDSDSEYESAGEELAIAPADSVASRRERPSALDIQGTPTRSASGSSKKVVVVTQPSPEGPAERTPTRKPKTTPAPPAQPAQSASTLTPPRAARTARPAPPRTPQQPKPDLSVLTSLSTTHATAATTDADYGSSTHPTLIDTTLGSYNTGTTPSALWPACLDFFILSPPTTTASPTAPPGKANATPTPRPRVPLKKLPGLSIGLFDYQLMGVFNLLRLVLSDVSGGLLCDEQGLGKTQEMFGVVALARGLRRCRAEVRAAWRRMGGDGKGEGKGPRHNKEGEQGAKTCPFDERWGFRCYCYCGVTRELAERMVEGVNVVVAPGRSCAALVKEAKVKMDGGVFKVRGFHEGVGKEEKLTPADVAALRGVGTAAQGEFIVVVSPEFLPRLSNLLGAEVGKKKGALLPGMVFMDEFHEYVAAPGESPTVAWLEQLKKSCLDVQQPTPLAYFVSGTPFGTTPADIRPAIALLEKESWQKGAHPLNGTTLAAFDELTATFDRLTGIQAGGETVPRADAVDYRQRLDHVLNHTMVRRLGTDRFQGRDLTNVGPLKVNITDHQLPASMVEGLQSLANETRQKAFEAAAARDISVTRLLRSKAGEEVLLRLRLASTFPAMVSCPAAASFTFTAEELRTHLAAANNDVTKTPYYPHVAAWSRDSPKLATLAQTVATMLADTTPVPGSPCLAKKLCIVTPLEAEAVLIHMHLLLLRDAAAAATSTSTPTKSSSSSKRMGNPPLPLQYRALKPTLLHSSLPASARPPLLASFLTTGNAPPNVLVAPMALAGTGLNLQQARYSIVMGPAWTRRENQQAYYRIHRVGQRMETRLGLFTGRWNPAERIVLGGYEGAGLVEGEVLWEVGNAFCAEEGNGLVEGHQGRVE